MGETADMPPCRLACPLGQDIPTYISAIAREDMAGAAQVIRETNALPSVCGRACIASCMRACSRAGIDEGVDIRGLKRFAVSVVEQTDAPKPKIDPKAPKVAVIGGGPTGLAAAHRLVQLGLSPVVFEASEKAGGVLVDVIPEFVLPREMVAKDVANLEKMGVEVRCGVAVGKDVKWAEVESDFDAVLVATGARSEAKSPIPGSELPGVTTATEFCCDADNGGDKITGPVVVQGGGNSALQAARTALRLGAKSVCVVHPAPLELWPAGPDAVQMAQDEGAQLMPEHRAVAITGAGKVQTVTVNKVRLGAPDGVGRPTGGGGGKKVDLDAALFVTATENRKPQEENRPDVEAFARGLLGNLKVASGYKLDRNGWYAAGEAATGAATVVDSMATGRLAAESIERDLAARREAK
jgi:NADPH-dependent glutamate synthase beta subunit-like oxidoreductase